MSLVKFHQFYAIWLPFQDMYWVYSRSLFCRTISFFSIRAKIDFSKRLNDEINEKKITYARVSTPMYHQENRNLLKVWYSKTGLIFYSTLKTNKSSIEAFFLNSKQRRI